MKLRNKIWMTTVIFFVMYYPPLISLNLIHIGAICAWGYCIVNLKNTYRILSKKRILTIELLLLSLLCYVACISIVNNTPLKSAVMDSFMWLFEIVPICIMLVLYGRKHNVDRDAFLDIIMDAGFIQGLLSIVNYYVPAFHNWVIQRLIAYGYDKSYWSFGTYRLYGLAHSMTFFMPIVQIILFILAAYSLKRNGLKYVLYMIILFFSSIINARTPFVIIIIAIVVALCLREKYLAVHKKSLIIGFSIMCIASLALYILYIKVLADNIVFQNWILVGMKSIFEFLRGNRIGYFSYFDEANRFVIPQGLNFIFGVGKDSLTDGGIANVHTDVGYVNYLWLGGIIYLVIVFYIFIKMIAILIKSDNKRMKCIGVNLLIDIFVLNIKGIIFSINEFTILIFILVFYEYLNNNLKEEKGKVI